ncbi:acyclic terpene utilization AtuA family protein [Aminivibrio sp.]|uniref:acyclic terpene utilization AtuA family protein n=1 Tax=Aminivibrio sp. TaxID=1872489 RepID=UPI00345ECA8F
MKQATGASFPLTDEVLDNTTNVTASMGVEQIVHAPGKGADVIIAGRACDDAVLAAYPSSGASTGASAFRMGRNRRSTSLVPGPRGEGIHHRDRVR